MLLPGSAFGKGYGGKSRTQSRLLSAEKEKGKQGKSIAILDPIEVYRNLKKQDAAPVLNIIKAQGLKTSQDVTRSLKPTNNFFNQVSQDNITRFHCKQLNKNSGAILEMVEP